MSTSNSRTFDTGRQSQGFRSQQHLDAWFRYYDHTQLCIECNQPGTAMFVDDGYQPTLRRCAVARELDQATEDIKAEFDRVARTLVCGASTLAPDDLNRAVCSSRRPFWLLRYGEGVMKTTTLTKIAVLVLVALLGYALGRHQSILDVHEIQDAEYVRVVGAIADAYGRDPSEVEQDAGLVDDNGNIIRGAK